MMRKLCLILSTALLMPGLALAQSSPATTADAHMLHNDLYYWGQQQVTSTNAIAAAVKAIPPAPDLTTALTTLNAKIDTLIGVDQALLAQLKANAAAGAAQASTSPPASTSSTASSSAPSTTTTTTTSAPPAGVALPAANSLTAVTVGPGQTFTEIADALPYVGANATVTVLAGTTLKSWDVSTLAQDNITITCQVALTCKVDGQGGYGAGHRMAWGKSMFHFSGVNATVVGFRFVNCGSPASGSGYSNEAAIYFEGTGGKTLTVKQSAFDNNANGIFGDSADGTVVVDGDVFGFSMPNGMNWTATTAGGGGPAHDMYLTVQHVIVTHNYFYGSVGHNVKTRSDTTVVTDNPLMTMDGGRVVDLAEGGVLTFSGNGVWSRDDSIFPVRTLQSGLLASALGNSNLIGIADENTNHGALAGTATGNTFHLGRVNSTIWANAGSSLAGSGNTFDLVGLGTLQEQGTVTGDLQGMSALPTAAAHAIAPPMPPAWFTH